MVPVQSILKLGAQLAQDPAVSEVALKSNDSALGRGEANTVLVFLKQKKPSPLPSQPPLFKPPNWKVKPDDIPDTANGALLNAKPLMPVRSPSVSEAVLMPLIARVKLPV